MWEAANMGNDIQDILLGQGGFPRRHITTLANSCTAFRDHQKQEVIRNFVDVAFFRQARDMGHEGVGAASAIRTVTALAIFAEDLLPACGNSAGSACP
jgi:hypothetical protein